MDSHELHNLNKAGPSTTPVSPAPGYVGYDPRTTNHATGPSPLLFYDEARVPVHPAQPTPWYRRKSCMISSIIVGAVLLLVAIGVGLAAVFFLKNEKKEDKNSDTATAVHVIPTTTKTSSTDVTSLTTVAPSTRTVTLTRSASESEGPSTIVQTITASEPEDIGEILSSLLTRYPYYTTELTTEVRTISNTIDQTLTREITLTQEPESHPDPTTEVVFTTEVVTISNTLERTRTTEVTITEEREPSETTAEVQVSLVPLTKASVGWGTTVYEPTTVVVTTTPSMTSTATSSTSSASAPTTSASKPKLSSNSMLSSKSTDTSSSASSTSTGESSLSTRSKIAAVDVLRGPSSLQRRLIVWQDEGDNLIARDSAEGNSTVYNINSEHADLPIATRETSLTAAVDDEGAVHVFFLDDEKNVQHIAQSEARDWKAYDSVTQISGESSLAATWHDNANDTALLVLALYDSTGRGKTQQGRNGFFLWVSADRGESWDYEKPGVFNDANHDSDNGTYGLAIASGIAFDQDNDDEPEEGDVAGLHVILQSERGILAYECLFDGDSLEDCWENERQFLVWDADTGESKPISIESHPTHLSFSRKLSSSSSTPAKIYGLFRHSSGGGGLSEYRYVRDIEGESSGGTTELHESMEVSVIFWNSRDEPSVRAAASIDDRTLIVARGDGLSEIVYDVDGDDSHWDSVGLIDTSLTEDEDDGVGGL